MAVQRRAAYHSRFGLRRLDGVRTAEKQGVTRARMRDCRVAPVPEESNAKRPPSMFGVGAVGLESRRNSMGWRCENGIAELTLSPALKSPDGARYGQGVEDPGCPPVEEATQSVMKSAARGMPRNAPGGESGSRRLPRVPMQIRPAELRDAGAISEIYNQGIEDRIATLETRLRSPEEQRAWLEARGPRHPVVVCERSGAVCGWASLNSFNPREAYDHVADFSVYVERETRGRGVGAALLAYLETLAVRHGYHKLVLAMFPSNGAGVALYRRRGFREVGTYREHGRVDGRWVDILIMEKILT